MSGRFLLYVIIVALCCSRLYLESEVKSAPVGFRENSVNEKPSREVQNESFGEGVLQRTKNGNKKVVAVTAVYPSIFQGTWNCYVQMIEWYRYASALPKETILAISGAEPAEQRKVRKLWKKLTLRYPEITVKYSFNEDVVTAAQNRNMAMAASTQPVITFFDMDDIPHPQRVEVVEAVFRLKPEVDAFYHSYNAMPENCASGPALDMTRVVDELSGMDNDRNRNGAEGADMYIPCDGCNVQHSWVSLRRTTFDRVKQNTTVPVRTEDTRYAKDLILNGRQLSFSKIDLGSYNMLPQPRCDKLNMESYLVHWRGPGAPPPRGVISTVISGLAEELSLSW